jgi:hyperosmotically inducible protein
MTTPQLIFGTILAIAVVPACNRANTDETAQRAAGEAREAAAVASDRLADGWLATKIQAQYFADEDVKARFINVSADEGVVTLRGRVDTEAARQEAVSIAKNTDGVRQVQDMLLVGAPANSEEAREAAWITTQIQARYFADSVIDGGDIDVATNDGVVTLSGRVNSAAEKSDAVAVARSIEGVTRVDDRLVVEPMPQPTVATTGTLPSATIPLAPIDDERVSTSIQAKYFVDNMLKGRRIEVNTSNGVVTLRGEVASDLERAQALLLARTTEGAQRVEDSLAVNAALDQKAAAQASPAAPAGAAATAAPAPAALAQDAALVKSVQSRLAGDRQARTVMVDVTVKDGVALLDGTAPNAAAKQRALTLARETQGVVQVVDRLRVARSR